MLSTGISKLTLEKTSITISNSIFFKNINERLPFHKNSEYSLDGVNIDFYNNKPIE